MGRRFSSASFPLMSPARIQRCKYSGLNRDLKESSATPWGEHVPISAKTRPIDPKETRVMTSARPHAAAPRMKLKVSRICFGTSSLSGMPDTYGYDVDVERAHATVRAIFDGPVNFLDTSNNYGMARSEQ